MVRQGGAGDAGPISQRSDAKPFATGTNKGMKHLKALFGPKGCEFRCSHFDGEGAGIIHFHISRLVEMFGSGKYYF